VHLLVKGILAFSYLTFRGVNEISHYFIHILLGVNKIRYKRYK